MRSLFFVISIWLLSLNSVVAQQQGRVLLFERDSTTPIDLGVTSFANLNDLKKEALQHYYSSSYLLAKIDSIRFEQHSEAVQEVRIWITRGSSFKVGEVHVKISGDTLPESELVMQLSGVAAENDRIASQLKTVQDRYESRGYAFAKITLTEMDVDTLEQLVILHIDINSGRLAKVEGLQFITKASYSSTYLRRLSRINQGALITPRLLEDSKAQLERSSLFARVSDADLAFKDSLLFIVFEVEPRNPNAFDLMLGYVPEADGSGTLVGTGKLHVRNIITEGSRLRMSFERLQQFVTKFSIEASQAWLYGLPIETGGSFHFIQQDTSYQVRNARFRGNYWLGNTLSVGVSLRREEAVANENVPGTQRVIDATTNFLGVSLQFDNLDAKDIPTRGLLIHLEAETGRRVNRSGSFLDDLERRYSQQVIKGDISWFYSVQLRQILVTRLFGYAMIAPRYLENDLARFGGAQTLRGYREDQFFANNLLWGDVEYRYLLDRDTYGFLFTAHGYYQRPQLVTEPDQLNKAEQYLNSYGFGLAYRTKLGMLRFTYAKSPEDPYSNAKIHFGIIGDF